MRKIAKIKSRVLIAVVILAIIIVIISLFSLLNKESAITAEKFKTKMERKGYTVSDSTNYFKDYEFIEKVYIATDGKYQVEFYEFSSDESAIKFYKNNRIIFEKEKDESSNGTEVSEDNYSKYTLNSEDKYKCLSRKENTVIFINVNTEYQKAVDKILDKLNY